MRNFDNQRVIKALLLAGGASTLALASPAMAQQGPSQGQAGAEGDDIEGLPEVSPVPSSAAESTRIVVTGSRIQRQDFEANSPIVTVDEEFLQQSSTAAVEQQLNRLPQFVVSQSSTSSNNNANGLQAAGGDIQPNATNTPGAATVSLRGVGANRTLVLIDGRRGTPGNASGAVDVSTIPSAALERVEVISGGASATYGADAVAGVTNFILKRNFEGVEIDAQAGISQEGVGFEYQISGIIGADFADGRGNVSFAGSLNERERVLFRDNPFYQRLWENPNTTTGAFFFVPRPAAVLGGGGLTPIGTAILNSNFPGANPAIPANFGNVFFNPDGSIFLNGFAQRGGGAPFYDPAGLSPELGFAKTTSVGTLAFINTLTPQTIPTTRYNFLARGNYEINDWIGVFGQGMFSHNSTYTVQEPGPLTGGWGVAVPWGSGVYTGGGYTTSGNVSSVLADGVTTNPAFTSLYGSVLPCANNPTGGCTNTQVFQAVVPQNLQALLNNRVNPNAPFNITGFLPNPRETFSDVKTYTLIAGLEGTIPGLDWTWEAFVNHGFSQNLSRQTGMYSLERTRALFTSPNFGQGFVRVGNPSGGGFGAATGRCTTGLNFFGSYEGVSDDCREAIAADVSNRITTRQTIAEANLQGGLFELPGGELRFALGASYRENRFEFVNETLSTAGRSFLDQAIGIYPSANMPNQGIDVKEFYGELLVPLLSDIPFIEELSLELGGRMSDYSTTGTSYTFKALADWRVTDWLRFRGGFNRSERAPNIAELLLAPQQSFGTDPIGDVCSTRHNLAGSANPTNNPGGAAGAADVVAVCQELIAQGNNGVYVPVTDTFSYYNPTEIQARQPTGGGFSFAYAVGNEYYRQNINEGAAPLEPEVADTWTAGVVIQSPVETGILSRMNLTVDYFNITIKDPIGPVPVGGILLQCVGAQYNPAVEGVAGGVTDIAQLNTPEIRARAQAALQQSTCPDVARNPSTDGGNFGQFNTANVFGTYSNDGEIRLSGIDAVFSWGFDVGPGAVFASLNGNYMFDFSVQQLAGQPFIDYVGTTGTNALGVNSGSSFEYRIYGNLGYSVGPASISLSWQHIPETEDGGEAPFLNGIGTAGTDASGLPAYNLFNLNSSYELNENVRIRFGVDNLLNTRPPLTNVDVNVDPALGQLPGGGYSLFHDVQGRRFSLGANLRF